MLRLCCTFLLWFSLLEVVISYTQFRRLKTLHTARSLKSVPHLMRNRSFSEEQVQGVDLSPLTNVVPDGKHLSKSIASWLDVEYIPQDIHVKLGEKVKDEYSRLRDVGVSDLGELLIKLGTALEAFDMENAFVNGWDVANKASELLMIRLDKYDDQQALDRLMENEAHLESVALSLSSGFERYRLLQRYLEGEVQYREMHSALGFLLGFRRKQSPQGVRTEQQEHLAPLRWGMLEKVPYFDDIEDKVLGDRLAADLPEEQGSADVVMESLMGLELYGQMRNTTDPAVRRRILIAQWMYIQGFLNNDFPAKEQYVPAHMQRELDDKDES